MKTATTARKRTVQALAAAAVSGTLLFSLLGLSSAMAEGRGNSQGSENAKAGDVRAGNAGFASNPSDSDKAKAITISRDVNDARNTDGTRPGFGCGDDNHIHTGVRNDDDSNPCVQVSEETSEPTATSTAAVSTATPVPTVQATNTATPATATPVPADTATPTATVTSSPTATATSSAGSGTTTTQSVTLSATASGGNGFNALIRALAQLFSRL